MISDVVELAAFACIAIAIGGLAHTLFAGLLVAGVLLVVVARGLDGTRAPRLSLRARLTQLRRQRRRSGEDEE